ncbi:Enolase [Dirofilaria immitis]
MFSKHKVIVLPSAYFYCFTAQHFPVYCFVCGEIFPEKVKHSHIKSRVKHCTFAYFGARQVTMNEKGQRNRFCSRGISKTPNHANGSRKIIVARFLRRCCDWFVMQRRAEDEKLVYEAVRILGEITFQISYFSISPASFFLFQGSQSPDDQDHL